MSGLHFKNDCPIVCQPHFYGWEPEHDVGKKDMEVFCVDVRRVFRATVQLHQPVKDRFRDARIVCQTFQPKFQRRLLQRADIEFQQTREIELVLDLLRPKSFHAG